jgi:hypothetical protein
LSSKTLDWNSIAEERLRLFAEATGGNLQPRRRQEIYERLLRLELTPEDIDEFIPGLRDEIDGRVAQSA